MVDPIEALVYVAIVALGITLALLPRSFMLPSLLIGLLLLVVGLLNEFGMTPVIDAHLNVSVENPKALFVLIGIVAAYAALAGVYFLWKRKSSKEQESSDMPPHVLEE
jgi:nitrate reductase gamma subunit